MDEDPFGTVIEVLKDGTAVVETTVTKIIDFVGEKRFLELLDEMVERERNQSLQGSAS